MFEPQGAGFFLLLMVVFAALIVWVAVAKQVVFRVLAACLAFIPAMMFGVASVNKFYDYYQTWGAMINDLTGSPAPPKTPRSATCSRRRSPGRAAAWSATSTSTSRRSTSRRPTRTTSSPSSNCCTVPPVTPRRGSPCWT